jgi:peptidoglycan lytic transglycosylase D
LEERKNPSPVIGGRSPITAMAVLLCTACAQLPQAEPETPAGAASRVIRVAAAATPEPRDDVWARVRSGFRLPNMSGRLVKQWEQHYSSQPEYVARMMQRASVLLQHVLEEVERRKLPTEIALLPMIESAYNPQAYSRSHASGMWQFMPSTGRHYGLRQDFWHDERRDVLAATDAALDYLQKLHRRFGDWKLALAAYNWGQGNLSRAIAENRAKGLPTSYENLALPPETRKYLPKLQAVKNMIANPQQFGIELPDIPNRPRFAAVTIDRPIDVTLAASLAGMELEDFRFLNPAYNGPVIKANGSRTIVLPMDRVEMFQWNLDTHDRPLVSWHVYTLKRSDQPEKIAAQHGLTLAQLKEINGIRAAEKIVPGRRLLVPLVDGAEPHLPDLPTREITLTRYKPRATKCYVVSDSGTKKEAQCLAPASGVSIRALTGG